MPWPKVPDEELRFMEEFEEIGLLYIGPVTLGYHRIVAYPHFEIGAIYPGLIVLMDDRVFDYYDFLDYAAKKSQDDEEIIWKAIREIVIAYYWKVVS